MYYYYKLLLEVFRQSNGWQSSEKSFLHWPNQDELCMFNVTFFHSFTFLSLLPLDGKGLSAKSLHLACWHCSSSLAAMLTCYRFGAIWHHRVVELGSRYIWHHTSANDIRTYLFGLHSFLLCQESVKSAFVYPLIAFIRE